jgi:hypothetical protein
VECPTPVVLAVLVLVVLVVLGRFTVSRLDA